MTEVCTTPPRYVTDEAFDLIVPLMAATREHARVLFSAEGYTREELHRHDLLKEQAQHALMDAIHGLAERIESRGDGFKEGQR